MACDNIRIPIDVVPGSNPPRFRWQQTVDTPNGRQVVAHEGPLPVTVEVAVSRTVTICKQLLMENAMLRGKVQGLEDQAERADDDRTERATATVVKQEPKHIVPKKGRG